MCSELIQSLNSCYIDDWANIFRVLMYFVSFGIIFGTLVGIIKFVLKR